MVYVKRDAAGVVVALSREDVVRNHTDADRWSVVADDAPEVMAFCAALTAEADPLQRSDLGFVRVLEDVIDLLVERSIIRFTDLPLAAQDKLMERRSVRAERHKLSLLDGSDDVI